MKFGFEVPTNLKEAEKILNWFKEAGIDPPQRIKDIILNATTCGYATGQERDELERYLKQIKEDREE